MSLFTELKRRNVIRVGIAYLLGAWVLLQAADFGLQVIDAPNWILQVLVLIAAIGLPAVLVFAWVFEMTPEGVKREKDIDRSQSITSQTGKKLDRTIIGILAVAVALLLFDRFRTAAPEPDRPIAATPATTAAAPAPQAPSTEPDRKSLAVLPFTAMSTGVDDEYFADGLTEEILNSLAQLPELLVTARTSAFSFKGQDLPVPEIASTLGVAHIVEGSVRKSGDRLRVTAQLIRASDGFHLWSENYDSTEADTIAVQEDIAEKIAHALDVVLDDEKRASMQKAGLRDVEAFIAYQKGLDYYRRAHGEMDTIEGLRLANQYFEEVLERVPGYAPAHREHSDLFIHVLQDMASGIEVPGATEDELANAMNFAIRDAEAAVEFARTPEEKRAAELDLAYMSGNWHGLSGRIEKVLADDSCDLPNWLDPLVAVFGYAEAALPRLHQERLCDPLASIAWFSESRMTMWAGDPEKAVEVAEIGSRTAPGGWLKVVEALALAASGELARADEIISSRLNDPAMIQYSRVLMTAIRGDIEGTERLLEEYGNTPDEDAFQGIAFAAWTGDLATANRLASRLDDHPFGAQTLLLATYWCACGSPWDLEVTPNFRQKIEQAGLAWAPPSPISFPLKDW